MKHYSGFEYPSPYSWHSMLIWRGNPETGYFICVPKPIAWLMGIYRDILIFYFGKRLRWRYRNNRVA